MPYYLKYLTSFFFPVYVVWFLATGPHDISHALIGTLPLWMLILVDFMSPRVKTEKQKSTVIKEFYDAILIGLAFLQFLIIVLMLNYASLLTWDSTDAITASVVNLIVLRILVGTTSGSSALIVAHELLHRSEKPMRILGRLLLYTVCYEHFVIAHMRGHHLSVATPDDIATARLGESFNSYWKRVYSEHFKYAWNSEVKRLGLTRLPVYHFRMLSNSVLQGVIVEVMLVLLILVVYGWAAAFIFLYQALAGVRLLETINYYQHWGLEQDPTGKALAWVNPSSFTEYALMGLANHIGHHQNAAMPFYEIPYSRQGPEMPYGYFVTNLWVKLNNESYRRVSTQVLKKYLQ